MITQGRKVNATRHNVEQGSDKWLELRKNHVCASDSLIIMGLSPWSTRQQLLEEKKGLRQVKTQNSAMKRGVMLEPKARACAEDMLGTLFLPEVLQSIEHPFMLASLDGVCIDNKIILEIKCTNKKNHELARENKIPEYYFPQVQHQISVCDVDFAYYFSFDGSNGVLVVVERDDKFIERMIAMEHEFYQEMTSG